MSETNPITLGAGALKNMRSFIGRGAKVSGPITAFCGIIADLASTIASFSLYLLFIASGLALISGYMWFARYKKQFKQAAADGTIQPAEIAQLSESNAWSVIFAFSVVATIVMAGFVIAAALFGKDDKGALASVVPGMDQVQNALFRVEKKVEAVKKDTEAIKTDTATIKTDTAAVKQDTAKIAASVEEIAKRFDAIAGTGGLIPEAKTPEEHYHNARVYELGGQSGGARKEYSAYLAADLETLDPWLNYSGMLKVQEGREGALETLRYFADKSKTVSFQVALALLEEREPRLAKLLALEKAHPDYGPLSYLISQEYSELKRGDTTLAEKRSEREWLEKFHAAKAAGKVVKYFLDKKEVQKWFDDADARTAKLNSLPAVLQQSPVKVLVSQSNSGWSATLILSDFKVKELFYKLDGKGDFVSTGHQPFNNPQTGLPLVRMDVPLPGISEGEHTMEVQYTDMNDQINGPYPQKFSLADAALVQAKQSLGMTSASWLSFRDFDGKVWLYFTGLLSYRPALQEIRYSVNNESLDQKFDFEPSKVMGPPGDKISIFVPAATTFACVQVTFKDGTKTAVQRFERKK